MAIFNNKKRREKQIAAFNELNQILDHYWRLNPYTKNPAYLGIRNSIATTFSTLDLGLYQMKSGGEYQVYDHPIAKLLRRPSLEDTQSPFLYRLACDYLDNGNAYIVNISDSVLKVLDPKRVTVTQQETGSHQKLFTYDNGKTSTTFVQPQIVHVYNPQYYDGLIGHSVLEYNHELIDQYSALLLYARTYFENSAGQHLTITLDKDISDGLKDADLKAAFEEWIQTKVIGNAAAGKPILLKPGLTTGLIQQTTNVDAELSSTFDRLEKLIAKLLGYPNHMLTGDYGNNLQFQQTTYYQSCILPIAGTFAEGLEKMLLREGVKDYLYMKIKFNYDNLLMPDTKTMHDMVREDFKANLIDRDESRSKLGY